MVWSFARSVCIVVLQVTVYAGPNLNARLTFGPPPAKTLKHEYSSLECAIEIVKNMEEAIEHIAKYGSGHTEVIVTENSKSESNITIQLKW